MVGTFAADSRLGLKRRARMLRVPEMCPLAAICAFRIAYERLQPIHTKRSLDPSEIKIARTKNLDVSELIAQAEFMVRL